MTPIDPHLIARGLLDQTVSSIGDKATPKVEGAKGTPSFESLLESLERLRRTGESESVLDGGSVEALGTSLRAADELHEEARALGKKLEAAFRERLDT